MARKLKTYVTSIGFFDLAVAAPSMTAAMDAWGSGRNLFKWGFAKATEDPAIVAATIAKPGVVLRRPVGSDGAFKEHAALPKVAPAERAAARPALPPPPKGDDAAARKAAAAAFERERNRRERERRREEAAQEKARRRRAQELARAEAALARATSHHEDVMGQIAAQRDALDRKAAAEQARWDNERRKLEAALQRARA